MNVTREVKYLYHSIMACHFLNLGKKHGITFIPSYIPTYLNVEANFPVGEIVYGMVCSSFDIWNNVSTLGSTRCEIPDIFTYQSMSAILHIVNSATSGSIRVECFQSSLPFFQASYIFPPAALVLLVLFSSKFLAKHVTVQYRHVILDRPCELGGFLVSQCLRHVEGGSFKRSVLLY